MFIGVDREKAIRAWQKGRDVRVFDRDAEDCAGRVLLIPLDNLLKGYEFLVDVPAVPDSEFEEAVDAMVSERKIAPAQKEEQQTPEEVAATHDLHPAVPVCGGRAP